MRIIIVLLLGLSLAACGQKQPAQEIATTPEKSEQPKNNLALHQHDPANQMEAEKLYACPMNAEYVTSDSDTKCTRCEMDVKPLAELQVPEEVRAQPTYTCAMHPEFVTSDSADQCPICEMNVTLVNLMLPN